MAGNPSSSYAGSFGSLPAEGDLIVVTYHGFASASPNWQAGDVTDNQGNAYSLAVGAGNNGEPIWWCVTGPTSGTFTVTLDLLTAGTVEGSMAACAYRSDAGVFTLDKTSTGTGTSTTPSTGTTATLTGADSVAVAVMSIAANEASITVAAGWTEEEETLNDSVSYPGEADSKILAATTGIACTWTLATSGTWRASIAVFKESPPAGGGGGGGGGLVQLVNSDALVG